MSRVVDMTGLRLGRLTVIGRADSIAGKAAWLCRCDCGKETVVRGYSLRNGDTQSCGCLHEEIIARGNFVHGASRSRLYGIWSTMKARCSNPNQDYFYRYGERKISVCEEWQTFEPFYEWAMANGYREDLTIDRMNNDGDYCPDNCRWATRKEQANNTSKTIHITYGGETHTLSEWSEIVGVPKTALWKRIYQRNWSVEKALTTPLQHNGKLNNKGE